MIKLLILEKINEIFMLCLFVCHAGFTCSERQEDKKMTSNTCSTTCRFDVFANTGKRAKTLSI